MVNCCFMGLDRVLDTKLGDLLHEQLEALVKAEEKVSFWFYGESEFLNLCQYQVLLLKNRHPNKTIAIVHVYDGTLNSSYTSVKESLPSYYERMFCCFADHKIFAPRAIRERPIIRNRYSDKLRDISRWVASQCSHALVYCYPNLQHKGLREIQYAKRNYSLTMLPLSVSSTAAYIQEQIDCLPERSRRIMNYLNQGKNKVWIGDELGLSSTTVQSHVVTANSRIKDYLSAKVRRIAGGLQKNACLFAHIEKLEYNDYISLNRLILYLKRSYGIQTVFVDGKSCGQNVVSMICANFCSYMTVTVVDLVESSETTTRTIMKNCAFMIADIHETNRPLIQQIRCEYPDIGVGNLSNFRKPIEEPCQETKATVL